MIKLSVYLAVPFLRKKWRGQSRAKGSCEIDRPPAVPGR